MVLGGSGFLGKSIVKKLSERGIRNTGFASMHNKNSRNKRIDILNYNQLEEESRAFDTVVNCTGQISFPINQCFLLNSKAILNLIKICNKYDKKLIQLSTVAVYGTTDYALEENPLNPETPYSTCKAYSEFLINEFIPDRKKTIYRISNLYGIGSKGISGYVYKSFISDRKLYFNNNGSLKRFFMHVDDCANLIVESMLQDIYGTYNLSGEEEYTVREFIKLVSTLTKSKFKVKYAKREPYENIENISNDKLSKEIKIEFKNNLPGFIRKSFNDKIK